MLVKDVVVSYISSLSDIIYTMCSIHNKCIMVGQVTGRYKRVHPHNVFLYIMIRLSQVHIKYPGDPAHQLVTQPQTINYSTPSHVYIYNIMAFSFFVCNILLNVYTKHWKYLCTYCNYMCLIKMSLHYTV